MRRRTAADVRPTGCTDTLAGASSRSFPGASSRVARLAACAAALVLAALALASCGGEASTESATDPMDAVYVEYMAALTISIEEGLSGEAAEERIADLGVRPLLRHEIDEQVQRLSSAPVRWSLLEEQVEARVEELRRDARHLTPAP